MVTMTDKPADPTGTRMDRKPNGNPDGKRQSSLPLFDDPLMAVIPAATPAPGSVKTGSPRRTDNAQAENGHLLEARRLARRMRRLRNQRDEQTRTGQAICHHLKAMLTESRPPN